MKYGKKNVLEIEQLYSKVLTFCKQETESIIHSKHVDKMECALTHFLQELMQYEI